ncbi:hypothetical protein B0T22DRAFT_445441 [Podospora appendiculata]|uniref:Uncharacterized protein n=1 Tax=Podospora appendiculata TaxID=314037 RepID=A0AAE0WZB0_9PEZI|nr:hypothetical protein B0T22DRAFT_445441 [Podospora appendiculata]
MDTSVLEKPNQGTFIQDDSSNAANTASSRSDPELKTRGRFVAVFHKVQTWLGFKSAYAFILYYALKAPHKTALQGCRLYATVFLTLVGACMLADSPNEGSIATQASTGIISLAILGALSLAIYNIRQVQIDQHRAWMIRAWVYAGFIITQRIFMIIIPSILTRWPEATRYAVMTCDQVRWIYKPTPELLAINYPACLPENQATFAPDGMVAIKGLLNPDDRVQSSAGIGVTFVAAGTLAFLMHAFFAELYLALTPREAERLRRVSYQRQLERGFKNPGSAGLVVQRIGDADPWAVPGNG